MIRIVMAVLAVIAVAAISFQVHNAHRRNLIAPIGDMKQWTWFQQPGASGGVSIDDGALKFDLLVPGPTPAHLQMFTRQIQLQEGQKYRVAFDGKASKERSIIVCDGHPVVSSASGTMGFNETPILNTTWKHYDYTFTAHNVDGQMDKLPWFQFSTADGTVWIKNIVVNEL
jgi:hypothetical protein